MNDRAVAEYIAEVAAPTPAPGGGSVSAMIGSLGCALGEMAVAISSQGKSGDQAGEFERARRDLETTRATLLRLAGEDETSYLAFRSAQALPKGNEAEKDARRLAIDQALANATVVPLKMAESGLAGLAVIERIAEQVSRYVLSDLSTATYALEASIKGALANVATNSAMMPKDEERARFLEQSKALDDRREASVGSITGLIASRT